MYFIFTAVDVGFQALSYATEEGSSSQVCAQLSSEAAIQVTVTLSITGGNALENVDFTVSNPLLVFQPGITLSCANIVAINDSLLEDDEVISLVLVPDSINVQATGTATVTIPNRNSMRTQLSIHPVITQFSFSFSCSC